MLTDLYQEKILAVLGATKIQKTDLIQELWSGYGKILRLQLEGTTVPSVIVKYIDLSFQNNHPRGWSTSTSHDRKLRSYEIETNWYNTYADKNDKARVPLCYALIKEDDYRILILEDLDSAGFPLRKSRLTVKESKLVLKWLANFHGKYLGRLLNNLWEVGTYWHLATRPDEFKIMAESELKQNARKLDEMLNNYTYKTIVHGDAKVANFCFSESMDKVAAVDFQYVGGGCGMKDVAYFLGSCLSEGECENYEEELLNFYFSELKQSVESNKHVIDFTALEKEWRFLYPLAWADFTRFLLGWMPTHQKINSYSRKMVEQTLNILE